MYNTYVTQKEARWGELKFEVDPPKSWAGPKWLNEIYWLNECMPGRIQEQEWKEKSRRSDWSSLQKAWVDQDEKKFDWMSWERAHVCGWGK